MSTRDVDSEFDKQYELYEQLNEVISKSKDFAMTGNGFVPLFGFNIDFVSEYGEKFYLSCVPVEETTFNDEAVNGEVRLKGNGLGKKTLCNGINKKPSKARN